MALGPLDGELYKKAERARLSRHAKKFSRDKRAKHFPHPTNPLYLGREKSNHPLSRGSDKWGTSPPAHWRAALQLPEGYPADLANLLRETDTPFRILYHDVDYSATEYFLTPKHLADEYGLDYYEKWWEAPLDKKGYIMAHVLTDDDYVAFVQKQFTATGKPHKGRTFLSGPLVHGVNIDVDKRLLLYSFSWRFARDELPDWWWNEDVFKEISRGTDESDDTRVGAFVDLFLVTGNAPYSYGQVFGERSAKLTRSKSKRLLQKKKVIRKMDERAKDFMRYSLEKAGITDSPEEYVMGALLKVGRELLGDPSTPGLMTEDPKLLRIAVDTIGRMGDYIGLGQREDVVETEKTLLLTEDDERRFAIGTEKKKVTPITAHPETVIDIAAEASEGVDE
jgi:hypothetical protein